MCTLNIHQNAIIVCLLLCLSRHTCALGLEDERTYRPPQHPPVAVTLLMLGSRETFSSEVGKLSMNSTLSYAKSQGYQVLKHVLQCNDPQGQLVKAGGGLRQSGSNDVPYVRACIWGRTKLLYRILLNAVDGSWFWMLDFDIMITNTSVRLEDIIQRALLLPPVSSSTGSTAVSTDKLNLMTISDPAAAAAADVETAASTSGGSTIDFIIAKRCNVTNTGSFLVRATPWARSFLKDVITLETAPQGAVQSLCKLCPDQEAMHHFMVTAHHHAGHIVYVPARWINAMPLPGTGSQTGGSCVEDVWRPSDFLVHFAGGRNSKQMMLNEFNNYLRPHHGGNSKF
ncbi:hypothetical protein CEUSTIGMA_g5380.t1 [Chlamydomonas eustigma]|uniref:Uncharacterized protein n=1 Tax=Chlamydomonas eustigma TaxID=1157962 RepID=A0A250X4C5_9CHLO|nr:hypothetical protein CEUSTIGMA_g5380.t1 [Chlamydomonas eustigma]|eukprot:GAX77938.1 hypothetical protein CEUSTIGMA_g5380.t1 [Chlamydomonas eustigma]